jgi:hypothetical protein
MQEQKLPLKPVDTELSEVLRVSDKLKMVDTKYKDDVQKIMQDDRYNESYKRDRVEDVRVESEAAVDALVAEFQSTVAAKSEDLESKLKPVSAANLEPPSVLAIESDRQLWIQQAIEEADIAFCEAVERFGRRRLKKLSNGGDRSAAENVGRLGELMAQRADASLTPTQRKAKSDIEKLKDIGGKFFEMAHLTKQYTLRRQQ